MIDKRTGELLNLLNGYCAGGSYKILSVGELLAGLPKKLGMDEDALRESLKVLQEHEYIRVKYEDETEFCLCTLPKGRLLYENKAEAREENVKARRSYFASAFFGAFFGSAAAIAIVAILYVLFFR